MNALPSQGYPQGAHYFQAPPPPPNPSYGNVYYSLNQGHDAHQSSYESKKRGYDALNEFFGDLKRRQFDPSSYAAVGQRLMGIQGLQLPMLNNVPEYQSMPAPVAVGGGGGGGYNSGGAPQAPGYHLPPMNNARTKDDLVNLDHVLEQMQNTIYESEENLQASGTGQPGAQFVHGPMNYRNDNSPPTQLPRSHVAVTSAGQVPAYVASQASSTETPALTPPSSAQSYTSTRSPNSTAQRVSPTQQEPSSHMYPRLPATTASDGMAAGYPTASTATAPSTLGGMFDQDDRRRYTGGTLQRARPDRHEPSHADEMDMSHDGGDQTPRGKAAESPSRIAANLIDPALHAGEAEDARHTAQAATEVAERADTKWVEKARLIEGLRNWISSRLEEGHFETEGQGQSQSQDENAQASPVPSQTAVLGDGAMEGVETEKKNVSSPRMSPDRGHGQGQAQGHGAGEVMYPSLRGAEETVA